MNRMKKNSLLELEANPCGAQVRRGISRCAFRSGAAELRRRGGEAAALARLS